LTEDPDFPPWAILVAMLAFVAAGALGVSIGLVLTHQSLFQ